jgi:hypothetical protein
VLKPVLEETNLCCEVLWADLWLVDVRRYEFMAAVPMVLVPSNQIDRW